MYSNNLNSHGFLKLMFIVKSGESILVEREIGNFIVELLCFSKMAFEMELNFFKLKKYLYEILYILNNFLNPFEFKRNLSNFINIFFFF